MFNNLLKDPMFTVDVDGQRVAMSLPQVLEKLGDGVDLEFAMLRRHQHHAWFAFLVQLAAIVCHRLGRDNPVLSAGSWEEALVDLAGSEEAWWLVVEDLEQPAFMQPPVPEGTLAVLKNEVPSPDALDVLIVSRNHDVKCTTMRKAAGEHWVFALTSLQTMQGFLGAGNYGVSRMNGGFASRPGVASAAEDDWSGRFGREVPGLLKHRNGLATGDWSFDFGNGATFLWTLPWDGTTSLERCELDPLYIEVCRRVRLVGNIARVGASKRARLASKEWFGDTGDFWTPVNREARKSLTVPAEGFTYKLFSEIAFSADWIASPAQPTKGLASGALLVARVLVRGQGETKGYHERVIPIPSGARRLLGRDGGQTSLGARSKHMVETASVAKRKVLKPSVLMLAQGAPAEVNFKDARFDKRLSAFDEAVDDAFFGVLFRDIEMADDKAQQAWSAVLWPIVRELFETMCESIPSSLARDYRARACAERRLKSGARKHLSGAFETQGAESGTN